MGFGVVVDTLKTTECYIFGSACRDRALGGPSQSPHCEVHDDGQRRFMRRWLRYKHTRVRYLGTVIVHDDEITTADL